MNDLLVLIGAALALASGVPGLFLDRRGAAGERTALVLLAVGAVCGVTGALRALTLGPAIGGIRLPWPVPGGAFHVEVDALSAMFLVPVFGISLLGAIYGLDYWKQADHPDDGRKLRLFYGVVTSGMVLLVCARNAVLFLLGWELMALAAFVLVSTTDRDPEVRAVGYLYLVVTRIGTLCLFATFALLATLRGDLDLSEGIEARGSLATAIFLTGFVGCGIKAGLMPFHVWLPGAHASAPSHVSALMSGVLIKMGVYALIRLTSLFSTPPLWWGLLALGLGLVSGVLGVAYAIGQHDIKRLLAYHSVENIGIIYLGLGLGLVGRAIGRPDLVVLGLGGCLLHVWNHGLFKALLFLAAGSVVHATGTRQIDKLGGLWKRMPRTGLAFLVGATAICGLPPLNGFISEFLIYLGLLRASGNAPGTFWIASALSAAGLALIGALALACFAKVFGAVFLGEPRSPSVAGAHEATGRMIAPMAVLGLLCAFIGLGSPLVVPALDAAAAAWAPELGGSLQPAGNLAPLGSITIMSAALLAALLGTAGWFASRLRQRRTTALTWDCGYAEPTARMQYTSSSFARGVVDMFRWALRPDVQRPSPHGPFPPPQAFHSELPDVVLDRLLLPAGYSMSRGLRWFRWVQRGSVHAYLVYILAALVLLLVWQTGAAP